MVDDSVPDRRLCRLLLEEAFGNGLEFWEDSLGYRGLKTCKRVQPDCVLLDYVLPDMTGLEFLAEIRGSDPVNVPAFAVVMLTGLADEQVAVDALKNGAQDYLIKDRITPEALVVAIERANEKVSLMRALKAERDLLARSLAEKDVLLKEVHHRVKNNLQVIASLLRLHAGSFEDEAMAGALRESQNRVESMALIHEQLYSTENLREVDLAEHAGVLAFNLFRCYGEPQRIALKIEIEPLLLGVDRAIPASLILNELVSNALKHAFPQGRGGSITIRGALRQGRVQIEVHDNGVGVPAHVAMRNPKSLGLEIVNILTRQLKGSFDLDRSSGTNFRICFPLS